MARIIVGVDGSHTSVEAIRWAVNEGRLRGMPVVGLHAWHDVYASGAPYTVAVNPSVYAEAGARVLERAVAEVGTEDEANVEQVVVHGGPAQAILEQASEEDLIVVGSRGRGGFAGLLLGSVSQQVVHHARCPVVVIPEGWAVRSS